MALASLILGIVSLIIGFIPYIGVIAIFSAIVGIILAIIDIIIKSKHKEKISLSIAGLILSILAVTIISFWIYALDTSNNINVSTNNNTNNSVDNALNNSENTNNTNEKEENKTYDLNEEVTVETFNSKYTIVINSISEMTERNQFSDKNPAQVFLIDYTYKNISGDELYISEMNFQILDEQNEIGYTYPNSVTNYPQSIPEGATCKAQMILAINNHSNKLRLNYKDNMFSGKSTINFKLNV